MFSASVGGALTQLAGFRSMCDITFIFILCFTVIFALFGAKPASFINFKARKQEQLAYTDEPINTNEIEGEGITNDNLSYRIDENYPLIERN